MTDGISTHPQFHLKTLFAFVTCVAVFCAAAVWVLQAETLDRFPFLFFPSIPVMGVGLLLSLLVCLGTLGTAVTFVVRTRPRPITSLIFFGCVVLAFIVDESAIWRLFLVMSSSAAVLVAETLVRRLPAAQIVTAVLAIVFTVGYYFLSLFGLASAGV